MVAVLLKRWRDSLGEWLVTRFAPVLKWELMETEYRVATFTVREQIASRTKAQRQLKTRRRLLSLAESVSQAILQLLPGPQLQSLYLHRSAKKQARAWFDNRLEVKGTLLVASGSVTPDQLRPGHAACNSGGATSVRT